MATVTRHRLRGRGLEAPPVSRRKPMVPRPLEERPLWQTLCLLYAGITLLAALVMTLAFSFAWAVA